MAQQSYAFWVKWVSRVTLMVAMSLILTKSWAWFITGSSSMLASLTDSVLDIAASGFNLWVLRFALQPADNEHRFGHGKAESLAGLAQAAFIAGSAALLVLNAVDAYLRHTPILNSEIGVGVTLYAMLATLLLVTFQRWVIARTGSVAVTADSLHYQGDLLLNGAVLLSLALNYYQVVNLDAWFAVAIAAFLLYNAWQVAKHSIGHLLDAELPTEQRQQIVDVVLAHPQVLGMHAFRTRQAGPVRFAQLHIELPDSLSLAQAHRIADDVERRLLTAFPDLDIMVHQDPVSEAPVGKERFIKS